MIIGISGGTGSGKTTVAQKIIAPVGAGNVVYLQQDSYYRNLGDMPLDLRHKVNYDHPDAFDTELLMNHLEALRAGEGIEQPIVYWVPSIAVSGLSFYTGDKFPAWKNNAFVGALRTGEIDRTGHIERIVFNDEWEEIRREAFLTELRQRIRDVRPGPDGCLYVLTDEEQGALLRIEPAE